MQDPSPNLIFKILTSGRWADGSEPFIPTMPIDEADGFLHLSTAAQLPETLALHFSDQNNLIVLAIHVADVIDVLRWEPSRGGDLFPHAYAPIPRTAVASVARVDVAADGFCELPFEFR